MAGRLTWHFTRISGKNLLGTIIAVDEHSIRLTRERFYVEFAESLPKQK
jgi:hypothetical protein